jgi:hypothetical protein
MSARSENLKKAFGIVIESGNIIDQIVNLKDVKWYQKLTPIVSIIDEAVDLLKVDWKELPTDIKLIDDADKAELNAWFIEKFDIAEENVEAIVEKSFTVLLTLASVIVDIVNLVKALKTPTVVEPTPAA